jgi:6-pyruvoyltetrahydropterin/6-carboxytetrahydropterin synthase
MIASVSRHAHFNAAHRLHVSQWSEQENTDFFGACNNPRYHGHNYELIVTLTGEIDPVTGYVYDMKVLGDLIKSEVEEALDHKNLNEEVPVFATLNPSAENIAVVIHRWLRPHIDAALKLKVTLYETPRNYVEFSD